MYCEKKEKPYWPKRPRRGVPDGPGEGLKGVVQCRENLRACVCVCVRVRRTALRRGRPRETGRFPRKRSSVAIRARFARFRVASISRDFFSLFFFFLSSSFDFRPPSAITYRRFPAPKLHHRTDTCPRDPKSLSDFPPRR